MDRATNEKPRRFKKILPVRLTPQERVEFMEKAGVLKKQIAELEASSKAARDAAKEQIDQWDSEREAANDHASAGTIPREVEVEEHFDDKLKTVYFIRTDTFATFEERTQTAEEVDRRRQQALELPGQENVTPIGNGAAEKGQRRGKGRGKGAAKDDADDGAEIA